MKEEERMEEEILSRNGSHDVRVADFDNDGLLDVIGANHGGDYQPIEPWRNLGSRDE